MTMLKALHTKLHLIYKHIYITSGLFTADILKALLKKESSGLNNWVIPHQFYQFFEIFEPSIFDLLYINICYSTDQENDSAQI